MPAFATRSTAGSARRRTAEDPARAFAPGATRASQHASRIEHLRVARGSLLLHRVGKLLRSSAVGLAATALDLVALVVLVEVFALTAAAANVPALVLGIGVQFAGNKWFAFRDRSSDLVRQGVQFALVEAGTLALNALVFHALVTWTELPYALARVLGTMLVYVAFSYPLWSRIFRPSPA